MANTQAAENPKHLKGFWPIFIIVVVALLAGGIIVAYSSGNILQDNIYSSNFSHKMPAEKASAKTRSQTAK